jgi:hypothetical protein
MGAVKAWSDLQCRFASQAFVRTSEDPVQGSGQTTSQFQNLVQAQYERLIANHRLIDSTRSSTEQTGSAILETYVITWPFYLVRGGPSLRPMEKTPRGMPDLANSPATSPIRMSYLHFHCCPFWRPCLGIRSPFLGLVIVGVVLPSSVNR